MWFSRLDVDINFIAAPEADGGRVEAFWREGYLSVEGLLAYLDVRQTPCSKGVLTDQSSRPPVLAAGQLLHPWYPCNSVPVGASCTQVPQARGTVLTYIIRAIH